MIKTIRVTQENIDKAQDFVKGAGEYCAIEYALQDAGLHGWAMGLACMYLRSDYRREIRVRVPQSVITWRQDFDSGLNVRPITFEIDVPDEVDGHARLQVPVQ